MAHGFTSNKFIRGLAHARTPTQPHGYATNLSASDRNGTSVTASATANTKGTYTELISATAEDSYGLFLSVESVTAVSATDAAGLMDIATGESGSEVVVVPNLNIGNPALQGNGPYDGFGRLYHIPGLFIPQATRIAARVQSANSSHEFGVRMHVDQMLRTSIVKTEAVAYGANTAASIGTSVTPGSSAYGSWTEIGTTSADHEAWFPGYDFLGDTTANQSKLLVEIGYGPDSGSVTSLGVFLFKSGEGNIEAIVGPFPLVTYGPVSSGTKLWARIAGDETDARGIIIHGI